MALNFDAVVIGAGPAGMTAAIYLKRANYDVAIIESNAPGGQINRTAKIENYPGFVNVDGPTLAYNMFMQIQGLGIPYKYGNVLEVVDHKDYKIVKTDKDEFQCKVVIIAAGRKPRELGLTNEKNLVGKGISWCAICDGPLFKDKEVAVVGGGNGALEESLYLADIARKVNLIHRRDEFRGDKLLADRVIKNDKINIVYDTVIEKLNSEDDKLRSLEVKNVKTNDQTEIPAAGLFIYIGFEPNIDMLKNLNLNMDNGYLIVDDNMRTNVDKIYACGDIIKKELYQITTAVGEGAKAAISATKDLAQAK